jgi:hypothetical protein
MDTVLQLNFGSHIFHVVFIPSMIINGRYELCLISANACGLHTYFPYLNDCINRSHANILSDQVNPLLSSSNVMRMS